MSSTKNKKNDSSNSSKLLTGTDQNDQLCAPCDTLAAGVRRQIRYGLCNSELQEPALFDALSFGVKEQMLDTWRNTRLNDNKFDKKQVAYFSLEFLMGRTLGNALLNLDLTDDTRKLLADYASDLETIEEYEHDAGLGNGGLGRLAACFLDSCASLDLAVTGYGIRYQYGMFAQKIVNGYQVEKPDRWLRQGNPWEVRMAHRIVSVPFFGQCTSYIDKDGKSQYVWQNCQHVLAVPYDMPIPGFQNGRINTLRLWRAEANDEFDLAEFNEGDYAEAVANKNLAEQITMVLYPNDASENGKELRLRQQYFLSSASLQDLLNRYVAVYGNDFSQFSAKNAIQLNDTHPSIAAPELMRLLMDEHGLSWDDAWEITSNTMAYTNHTLLPEALERWPVPLMEHMLPRIMQIIYEINARFLHQVAQKWSGDPDKLSAMSIIEEGPVKHIRMAYLAIVASFSVNGVAGLHTQLLKAGLFNNFYQLWPEKFNNRTNGVTPRRWMINCNPKLTELISRHLGNKWIKDLDALQGLSSLASDQSFVKDWADVKQANKQVLADFVYKQTGVRFETHMMFDVQVKRIHEYKRQLLNVMHVIHLYQRILNGDTENMVPRCVLIGGKAAPGYAMAKQIIKLINNVAHMINNNPKVTPYLRLAFLPNYNVSAMEKICPGTDLSEQISTAGKEASGTGNMKFMMNGALTIGTLDGANVEMIEEVGQDNFFLFGLTAEQVHQTRYDYQPQKYINESPALQGVIDMLKGGHFNLVEPGIFDSIVNAICDPHDQWMLAADFDDYCRAQNDVSALYANQDEWQRTSILNSAASGRFSSDKTIAGYRDNIWYKN